VIRLALVNGRPSLGDGLEGLEGGVRVNDGVIGAVMHALRAAAQPAVGRCRL
jgi:hypothetical protein